MDVTVSGWPRSALLMAASVGSLAACLCCGCRPAERSGSWVTFRDSSEFAAREMPQASAILAEACRALDATGIPPIAERMLHDCTARLALLSFHVGAGFGFRRGFEVQRSPAASQPAVPRPVGVVYVGISGRRLRMVSNFMPRPPQPPGTQFLLMEPADSFWYTDVLLEAELLGDAQRLFRRIASDPHGLHVEFESEFGSEVICVECETEGRRSAAIILNPLVALLSDPWREKLLAASDVCALAWGRLLYMFDEP